MKITITPAKVSIKIKPQAAKLKLGTPVVKEYTERPAYEGSYEVTPSAEAQVLHTNNLRMTDDVTIAPIPNNYGLITWNGSVITVS